MIVKDYLWPFRHWVVDGWCEPAPCHRVPPADSPLWEARYDNDTERCKRTSRRIASPEEAHHPFPAIFARMRSPVIVAEWAQRAAIPLQDDFELWGGGLHVMDPGGFLQVHIDYDRHLRQPDKRRAMNLIAFLNPQWEDAWGGALLLCLPSGEAAVRIYPRPGRLMVFETHDLSYHGVEQVSPDAPVSRVTAAVYYLTAATAANVRTRALYLPNRTGGVPREVALSTTRTLQQE